MTTMMVTTAKKIKGLKTSTKILIGLSFLGAAFGIFMIVRRSGPADLINLALSQVGLREDPSGSNSGPQIDKFTGGRPEFWCAHFIAWLFRTIGRPLPGDRVPHPGAGGENPRAGVTSTEQMAKDTGKWLSPDSEPMPGDVVFYATRGAGDTVVGRHIGLVVATTDSTIETVEGNYSDMVARVSTPKTSSRITGYGRFI